MLFVAVCGVACRQLFSSDTVDADNLFPDTLLG